MSLRQRQPRVEDPEWLAIVRKMPCLVCGRPGPSDPAHIRTAAPRYGKRYTGKGEKPDDKWVLPLCRRHHDAQHRESELGWWAGMGLVDPFAVAVALYASRPNPTRAERPRKAVKVRPRKPKAERGKIAHRDAPIPQRVKQPRRQQHSASRPMQRKGDTP